MTQLNMQITDFNLDYLSSDEKNRFYKVFQILNDIWDRTQEQIISTCKKSNLSPVFPSIHTRGYHTIEHTTGVVKHCYQLALPLHTKLPQEYTAIDVLVLVIAGMLHDYIQEGDINLVIKKYTTLQNNAIVSKTAKIPVFKRETGNNEFSSANIGIEWMKEYNKQYNMVIFKPENINALLNLIQSTEPDFGRVVVLEGDNLIEYTTVVQPKLINPIVITRWIICVSDLGTVAFCPDQLINDAYKLIREEIWESNLIKILNGELNPRINKLAYQDCCIISSIITEFINFQSSFVKAQKQRTKNYIAMFEPELQELVLPFFENFENESNQSNEDKNKEQLSNFDQALKSVDQEIMIINNLHQQIINNDYNAFLEMLVRAQYIK